MSATDQHDEYAGDDCPNCGGTGFVYDCVDGFCEDAEDGCELCERRCDWCNHAKKARHHDAAVCASAQVPNQIEPFQGNANHSRRQ